MSFWSDLDGFRGPTNLTISLLGDLSNAQNKKSAHRGGQTLVAATSANTCCIYTDKQAPTGGPSRYYKAKVYWLPWAGLPGKGQITEVTWDKLEKDGADYFLTSEFTGCRFVVDDLGISHVAYGAGNAVPGPTTSAQRDGAEGDARLARSGRRRMSISVGANLVYAVGGGAYAVAFGYKDASRRWKFKVWQCDGLGNQIWSNF